MLIFLLWTVVLVILFLYTSLSSFCKRFVRSVLFLIKDEEAFLIDVYKELSTDDVLCFCKRVNDFCFGLHLVEDVLLLLLLIDVFADVWFCCFWFLFMYRFDIWGVMLFMG
jgi:hypothetical protein